MKDIPNQPVPYRFEGSVKELLCIPPNKKNVKKLFYQILAMPLHELENKKPFKVQYRNIFALNICLKTGFLKCPILFFRLHGWVPS